MAANTATKVTPDIDAAEIAAAMAKLGEAGSALEYALQPFDALEEMSQRDIDQSVLWMLDGFSADLLLDVEDLAKLTLRVRCLVNGGFTPEERRIHDAFNFND